MTEPDINIKLDKRQLDEMFMGRSVVIYQDGYQVEISASSNWSP